MESEALLQSARDGEGSVEVNKLVHIQQRPAKFDPPSLVHEFEAIGHLRWIGFALECELKGALQFLNRICFRVQSRREILC